MKSESKIQQEIFKWFWNNHCLKNCERREMIFHVPNEGQHRLVHIGVYAGVSDLVLTWRGRMVFCEVKTPTGKQSKSQERFENHCSEVEGTVYFVSRSLEEFKNSLGLLS